MRQWFTATAATSPSVKIAGYSTSGVMGAEAATRMFSAVPATMTRRKISGRVCTDGAVPVTMGFFTDSYSRQKRHPAVAGTSASMPQHFLAHQTDSYRYEYLKYYTKLLF
jgi:hypothetical protein